MSDFAWLREQVTERKLANCSDACLTKYLTVFGNRQIALEAIDAVWHGQTYRPPIEEGAQ